MAKNYVVTCRSDIKDIATICRWMIANNSVPENRTAPVAFAVETLAALIRKGATPLSEEDAFNYLSSLGILSDERSKKAIVKTLQKSALKEFDIQPSQDCSEPSFGLTEKDLIDAAKKREEELSLARSRFADLSDVEVE